uniref:Uncharacterized protein n=1 Tax=Scleropages formosus TaxID=113540 RepID=A0A8C9V2Q3_SCLFO
AMLDEVHLLADGALPDDVVLGLEDLKTQLGEHGRHKVRLSVGKQGHGGHQLSAVEHDKGLLEGWTARITQFCWRFSDKNLTVHIHYSLEAISQVPELRVELNLIGQSQDLICSSVLKNMCIDEKIVCLLYETFLESVASLGAERRIPCH